MATLSRRELTDANRRATERALLDATIALLEEGAAFADISIEQIVKRAGFSRPTFYAYFRDKRDIVLRLGRDLEAAVAVAADPWLRDGVGDIRPTLAAVLDAFRAHRAAVAATVEAATYDPEVASSWARFHDDFRAGRPAHRGRVPRPAGRAGRGPRLRPRVDDRADAHGGARGRGRRRGGAPRRALALLGGRVRVVMAFGSPPGGR